jgi:hypothetical protein
MQNYWKKEKKQPEAYDNVIDGLKKIYKTKLLPLEQTYRFNDFHSPALEDSDFDSKPMILLVGQYSTGKTSFIRYLIESDFPGIRIGPEPTTDSFNGRRVYEITLNFKFRQAEKVQLSCKARTYHHSC